LDTIFIIERKQFVVDLKKGLIYNYGAVVDFIFVLENGSEVDMGIEYDHFGELAFQVVEDSFLVVGKLTDKQIENRTILRKVMKKAGFSIIDSEWWHFDAFLYNETKNKYTIVE